MTNVLELMTGGDTTNCDVWGQERGGRWEVILYTLEHASLNPELTYIIWQQSLGKKVISHSQILSERLLILGAWMLSGH